MLYIVNFTVYVFFFHFFMLTRVMRKKEEMQETVY